MSGAGENRPKGSRAGSEEEDPFAAAPGPEDGDDRDENPFDEASTGKVAAPQPGAKAGQAAGPADWLAAPAGDDAPFDEEPWPETTPPDEASHAESDSDARAPGPAADEPDEETSGGPAPSDAEAPDARARATAAARAPAPIPRTVIAFAAPGVIAAETPATVVEPAPVPAPEPEVEEVAPPGPASFHQVAAAIAEDPHGWEFGAAVRALQAARPDLPAVSRSGRIEEDAIRFGQPPSLRFESAEIRSAGWVNLPSGAAFQLSQIAIGPLGPKGSLPNHVTEDAMREEREGRRWLTGFLDIFTHRIAGLLFRAWALPRPAVMRDRPEADPWPRWVGSLFGAGPEPFRDRDALDDDAKRHMAGWLSMGRATAAGLSGVLGVVIGAPVKVEEFAPEWLAIPQEAQSRLAPPGEGGGRLGAELVLGRRFHSVQTRVRVRAGPLTLAQHRALLPGGERHAAARGAVLSLAGPTLGVDLQLALAAPEVPALKLDGALRLGWESWLGWRSSPLSVAWPGGAATGGRSAPHVEADELVLRMEYAAA
ncbi:type VI secretion system baseplate subunit TssG [Rubrimonas cliftonensis]|uniref:Type VI secretion protein, VC_A0111 family n=1 Tax=Rubrimonas cliftonensis TaxID=89524 RepID=A0A1H4BHJ2_9RHOB|nr:type VI secretion system baseplate subunit TssG [Rubrimonas cliftonensis]SEA47566.1 type VI secretion protein, VC_A0111 family [Rubrimonas cliftonensis]